MRSVLVITLCAACGPGPADDASGVDGSTSIDGTQTGSDDRLYPLAPGRVWTYDVTSTYPSCPSGRREQRVLATGTTEGRATFEVSGFCGLTGHSFVDGDVVEEYYDWGPTGWMRALDAPVAAGHTWTTTNGSATFGMTYRDEGSVAGHADCWRVTQEVSYTTYWIYCRGVGLVRYELIDLGGGTIRADLASKNF